MTDHPPCPNFPAIKERPVDFEFYNETGERSLGARVLSPARRAVRRLLRPAFYRLRELLQHLAARQQSADAALDALAGRLTHAEAGLGETRRELADCRSELADCRGELADCRADLARGRAELVALRQAHDLARPLAADYNALARRVDEVEDRLVGGLVARAA